MSAMAAHDLAAALQAHCAQPALSPALLALDAQLDQLERLLDEHAGATPAGRLGEVLRQVEIELDVLGAHCAPGATAPNTPAS